MIPASGMARGPTYPVAPEKIIVAAKSLFTCFRITTAHSPTRSVADGWLTSPTYSLSRVTFAPLAHSRQRNQQRFLLAPDTYAVRVTGDFKAAPGLTTARNGLSAFGGFARLRLTHLPLSGESPTIHQHGRQLARGD